MPRNLVFLSSGDAYVGELLELHKGVEYRFEFQEGTWDIFRDAAVGKGLLSLRGENPVVFLEVSQEVWGSSCVATWMSGSARIASGKSGHILSCDKHFWIPLKSLQGKYTSDRLVSTNSVFLSSGDRDFWVAFKVHLGNQASS